MKLDVCFMTSTERNTSYLRVPSASTSVCVDGIEICIIATCKVNQEIPL